MRSAISKCNPAWRLDAWQFRRFRLNWHSFEADNRLCVSLRLFRSSRVPAGAAFQIYAAATEGRARATVSPMVEGFGATKTPAFSRISTFSWADSPKAEMMAPA